MMERTDRHFRYLVRLISRRTLLYTEMISTSALVHGDAKRLLRYHSEEHPVAIQLGGSDPMEMAQSARLAADYGYDEININVGCPSNRVQQGRFGACLMAYPRIVAECVAAIRSTVAIPVSVKTRIGIDSMDSYEFLADFIEKVSHAGCRKFVIHARKAILKGLSPKQNRTVPPLNYDTVFQIKQDYPGLEIVINGEITNLDKADDLLNRVDGVMIGREGYKNPYIFADVDQKFYMDTRSQLSRVDVLKRYLPYIQREVGEGVPIHCMTRHLFGLFHARPRAKEWRRNLGQLNSSKHFDGDVIMGLLKTSDVF